jgi:tetratricopeptide (TPR) repeat protein
MTPAPSASPPPTAAAILEAVNRVRHHIPEKMQEAALLLHIVKEYLAGEKITETTIAEKFFRIDRFRRGGRSRTPIVRVTACNLRETLQDYYANDGIADPIEIDIPKGGYIPAIRQRTPLAELSESARLQFYDACAARDLRTIEGFRTAITLFHEILADHPGHAASKACLAEVLTIRTTHGAAPPRPDLEGAYRLATEALEKSPNLWRAHLAIAAVHACLHWDWQNAQKSFDAALQIGGEKVRMQPWFAFFAMARGQFREVLESLEQALGSADEPSPLLRRNLSLALILSGDYARAIIHANSLVQTTPSHYIPQLYLSMACHGLGDDAHALEHILAARALPSSDPLTRGMLVLALARTGKREAALSEMAALHAVTRYVPVAFNSALAHIGLGQYEEAIEALEIAGENREPYMLVLPYVPMYKPLHEHPRFKTLLRRMNHIVAA